ncbi:MAG: ParB/RepB/Spo0J family partition protein [Puniceicoccales bacterium]|nr:ParB/RepB/Spo0J family partition protein [Puniceicoccales bacterium]
MPSSPKNLGRGLSTLISGSLKSAVTTPAKKGSVPPVLPPPPPAPAPDAFPWQEIPVAKIVPGRAQPRREFSEQGIEELAASIQAEGLMQPVVVRKVAEGYELIAGERRWRAFKKLALKTIPARVVSASDSSAAVMSLIENLQRSDLNAIEEAVGYASLMRDFNLKQEDVAERVGKPRATVANSVRLLSLDREIQGYLSRGMLSAGHAKVILGLENEAERSIVARRVVESGASVRMAEAIVKKLKASGAASLGTQEGGAGIRNGAGASPAEVTAAISEVEKRLISRLNTNVRVKHSARQGKIIIEYYGNEDLQRILEKIGAAV